jgi:hypothetical protein
MLATAHTLAAIAWDPEIRNILSLLVGVVVLFGSVYLIVATNTGIRTGMLIVLACAFGWMASMGVFWWIYGNVGMLGREPSWKVEEINYADLGEANLDQATALTAVEDLPTPREILADHPELEDQVIPPDNPDKINTLTLGDLIAVDPDLVGEYHLDQLGGWELLATSDRQRGDAAATADAALGPDGANVFGSSSEYSVVDVYSLGGKPGRDDDSMIGRIGHKLSTIWHWHHPTHYAVVQVQAVVPQETPPGEAPPAPIIDEQAPVVSVVMTRDLGDKRFPAFMFTALLGVLFAVTCTTLHRRDKVVARNRSAAAPA